MEIIMIELSIEEPMIEKFFNNSKDEILKTLKFIADNNLKDFKNQQSYELTKAQKKELDSRIKSFHDNPSMGRSWEDIKSDLKR
jgi:predicted HAD superfamily phosphohydrolase